MHDDTFDMRLRLRLDFPGRLRMGPGKADLLEAIGREGSIAAAGRTMGMSYRRAWALVEEMNAAFAAPLVLGVRGGARGGGARLTETGETVLRMYRTLESRALTAGRDEIDGIAALLAAPVQAKQD